LGQLVFELENMKLKSLRKVTTLLRNVLVELKRNDPELKDSNVRPRYAEYLTALMLAEKGHDVQLFNERELTSADIYLPKATKKRVEVKTCLVSEDGWAAASFGVGTQIIKKKFDYCVFMTFGGSGNEGPENIFIFTREELEEVATLKGRRGVALFEATNPCLLLYAPSSREYEDYVKKEGIKAFKIEQMLCKHPEKFRNAWDKIR
jgi:hypothetical protein